MSYALDTNGQNARYVRAAERWGEDPDVLRAFAVGRSDPAGVVGRFALAAEKFGGLRIRSAHRSEAYFAFPRDLVWDSRSDAEVRRLAEEADIIHLNNSWKAYKYLRLRHKPALLHHHGTLFRSNPAPLLHVARQLRFVQAVSTIDLLRYAPDELTWLPTAYDIDALARLREQREPDGRIRVVSAPTNRAWKSTEALEAAVRMLQAEGLPIDLVLVEGKTWAECMATKSSADIYFDQVILGYGCNAVEAWAMGIPVVAGADEWTQAMMRKTFDDLPYYEAHPDTIASALRDLVQSADLRAEYGAKGYAHVRRFHDERPALTRLVELYSRALEHRVVAPSVAPLVRAPGMSWGQVQEAARQRRQDAKRLVREAL